MQQLQAWQVTQLHHLFGHAERARNEGLRGDHRGHGGQAHQRHQQPVGGHQEKRVLHSLWVLQQQRTLAKVIERETGHDDGKPSHANRLLAKMPHVGIQGLTAGDAQHHCAQDDEGGARLRPHEHQRVMWADGPQNGRILDDVRHAQHRNGDEPHNRDGPKKLANARRATLLHGKQAKQNDEGDGNDPLLECR